MLRIFDHPMITTGACFAMPFEASQIAEAVNCHGHVQADIWTSALPELWLAHQASLSAHGALQRCTRPAASEAE